MNRILFEPGEITDNRVTFGGVRAEHVLNVMHGEIGQTLKTGVVNGKIGTSQIVAIDPSAPSVTVVADHHDQALAPWVDLILAPPRPRVMKRLLPQLASLGVGRIFLVGAKKVEKDFWGATLLKEENWRPLLVEGLMQAGTTALPTLETRRNFRRFVNDELDALWPSGRRLVAHPYAIQGQTEDGLATRVGGRAAVVEHKGQTDDGLATRVGGRTAVDPDGNVARPSPVWQSRLILAIGPEGGWTDDEVSILEAHGFARYSLGPRILRTDTATVALLSRLMPVEATAGSSTTL